jgi:hypothetical protein
MDKGPCGLNGGGRDGCGTLGLSDDLAAGVGGNGLFGGWDGLPMGVGVPSFRGAGHPGRSFAGGSGGTVMTGPRPISFIQLSVPSGRERSIPSSCSKSIPTRTESMVAIGGTSTHGGDGTGNEGHVSSLPSRRDQGWLKL